MEKRYEWKKSQVSQSEMNDQLYDDFVDPFLKNYLTTPKHDRYNDARLIIREIVDNLYKWNSAQTIIVVLMLSESHQLTISFFHDGHEFNPFDPAKNCKLLIARDKEYKFNSQFIPNKNGNYEMHLKMDLSSIVQGEKDEN